MDSNLNYDYEDLRSKHVHIEGSFFCCVIVFSNEFFIVLDNYECFIAFVNVHLNK